MKIYTQEEFDAIPRNEYGWKVCPTGNYSTIKDFPSRCDFGMGCIFGEFCSFVDGSRFGACCSFGAGCDFGAECRFGVGSRFGARCNFGDECKFGEWFRFGEMCRFGAECTYESGRVHNGRYVAVDRIGRELRKAYFIRGDEGLFVRAGCWFGTFDEFEKRVHEVHKGTRHERDYINALIFARGMLEDADE